jgi:hypothetical protein
MEALGDAKALQLYETRKAQCVDKIVNPPMRAPATLMNQRASLLPGEITYVDAIQQGQTFAPAMEISPAAVQVIDSCIREHEERIKAAFYADLWLMLAQSDNPQMTAREVAERHEEKMLQLGPVLERLQDELLDPLIDRTFGILLRRGQIAKPPPELQGSPMRVEYISILAQAQKAIGITALDRMASFTGNLAAAKPDILDKVDFDELVDSYADSLGIAPAAIRSDEQVAAIRNARAQAQQQAVQQQQQMQNVQGAKILSETQLNSGNALSRILEGMGAGKGQL